MVLLDLLSHFRNPRGSDLDLCLYNYRSKSLVGINGKRQDLTPDPMPIHDPMGHRCSMHRFSRAVSSRRLQKASPEAIDRNTNIYTVIIKIKYKLVYLGIYIIWRTHMDPIKNPFSPGAGTPEGQILTCAFIITEAKVW